MRYRLPYIGANLASYPFSRYQRTAIRAIVSRNVPAYSPSFPMALVPAYPQRAGSG